MDHLTSNRQYFEANASSAAASPPVTLQSEDADPKAPGSGRRLAASFPVRSKSGPLIAASDHEEATLSTTDVIHESAEHSDEEDA